MLCHGTVCVVGKMRDLILQLSKSSIYSTKPVGMRQRHQELVVWRTLGAGKKLLRTTLWCEFAMLGFVSGLVAAIGAETALAVLQAKVFDFPWEPDWRLWIVLPCSGALLLSLFGGWLGARLVKGKALFRQFAG
ncbi:FtsX-like permease family protein [Escherichia coli]|uniref:FtsX-like permease family protein n=1 Tax=Escherichia coli TaxID=562 RepID=UPI002FCD6B83